MTSATLCALAAVRFRPSLPERPSTWKFVQNATRFLRANRNLLILKEELINLSRNTKKPANSYKTIKAEAVALSAVSSAFFFFYLF
jgi:hypothetical protein